jgi:hypothetical protein
LQCLLFVDFVEFVALVVIYSNSSLNTIAFQGDVGIDACWWSCCILEARSNSKGKFDILQPICKMGDTQDDARLR